MGAATATAIVRSLAPLGHGAPVQCYNVEEFGDERSLASNGRVSDLKLGPFNIIKDQRVPPLESGIPPTRSGKKVSDPS